MYMGPLTNGLRVVVKDLDGERVATISGTGVKNGWRIVILDDGTWAYVTDVLREATADE
jgi:hypothetical protein